MILRKYYTALTYGVAHGVNDFIAGFMLAKLSYVSADWKMNTWAFLGYSIIAFGGQLPAGVLVDKSHNVKRYSGLSIMLMLAAVICFYANMIGGIMLSAVASAFIHVCGGAACFQADRKNAALSGIFTSPGVVGLIIGGIIGSTSFNGLYYFLPVLVVLLIAIYAMSIADDSKEASPEKESHPIIDTHDFFMLILLLAIALRSLLWNIIHMECYHHNEMLIGIAFSAFAGKLLGGFITAYFDWKKYVVCSMVAAVLCLSFGRYSLPMIYIGVALLQSAVPITLLLMQNYMQHTPATATGLSLGISIVLAGLPTYIENFRAVQQNKTFFLLLSIAFLLSNYWVVRRSRKLI